MNRSEFYGTWWQEKGREGNQQSRRMIRLWMHEMLESSIRLCMIRHKRDDTVMAWWGPTTFAAEKVIPLKLCTRKRIRSKITLKRAEKARILLWFCFPIDWATPIPSEPWLITFLSIDAHDCRMHNSLHIHFVYVHTYVNAE